MTSRFAYYGLSMWLAVGCWLLLQDGAWLKGLEEGKQAAAKSGKPILLVMICGPGGCPPCEEFRGQVMSKPSSELRKALSALTLVEWRHNADSAKWAKEHGSTNPDPAYLVWLVNAKGEDTARWLDRKYIESEFLEWIGENVKLPEKKEKPKIAFSDVTAIEQGKMEAIDAAREEGKIVLIYLQLPGGASGFGFKGRAEEIKACRDFEKGPLASAAVIELSKKFACFRIDLAKDKKFAEALKLETAPAIVLWGEKDPVVLKKPAEKDLVAALKSAAER